MSLCQEEAKTQQQRERWTSVDPRGIPIPPSHPQLTHALADLLRLLHVVHVGLGGSDAEGVTLVVVLHPLRPVFALRAAIGLRGRRHSGFWLNRKHKKPSEHKRHARCQRCGLTLRVGGDGGVVANGSINWKVAADSCPGSTGSYEHTGGPRSPCDKAHQRVLDGDAVVKCGSVRPLVGGAINLRDRLGIRSKSTGSSSAETCARMDSRPGWTGRSRGGSRPSSQSDLSVDFAGRRGRWPGVLHPRRTPPEPGTTSASGPALRRLRCRNF